MQVPFQGPDSVLVERRVRLEVDEGKRILESGVNQSQSGTTEAKSRVDPVSISDIAFRFLSIILRSSKTSHHHDIADSIFPNHILPIPRTRLNLTISL